MYCAQNCLLSLFNISIILYIYNIVVIIILQLLSKIDYSILQILLETIQIYILLEKYIIVKQRSKLDYKFNKIAKITINCKRNNYLRKKSNTKQKKTNSIKINCFF